MEEILTAMLILIKKGVLSENEAMTLLIEYFKPIKPYKSSLKDNEVK
jgi:hypothetical protein